VENHKGRCVELLHKYIDYIAARGYFGQTVISWEKGKPIVVKENSTLNFEDIERLVPKKRD
jgi:hypothetical protein